MDKKIFKIIIWVVVSLAITLLILYLIDIYRMNNNETVLFSTWGKSYDAPTTEIGDISENDIELESLPNEYTLQQMVKDGCVAITNNNKIYNKDKLDNFIKNTEINSKNRIEDSVKIVRWTTEGDPIILELSYKITDETQRNSDEKNVNKTKYILRHDSTRDKFSSKEDRKIITNDDIPGEIYGIMEEKQGDTVSVDLRLYAEIDYINENVKKYEDIHICSYSSDVKVMESMPFEIRFYDKHPDNNTKINKILDRAEMAQYDYDIYTYDGQANILIDGEEMSLRNALLENKITMEEIIKNAESDLKSKVITGDVYKDGGSKIYEYDSFTIIKCNRLDGNKDVYIGRKGTTINDLEI